MEIALEMHSVWNLPSAIRIAKAVEPYDPMWFEDPIRMDNLDALAEFKASTHVPTTASAVASARKRPSTVARDAPMARSVPISPRRAMTEIETVL